MSPQRFFDPLTRRFTDVVGDARTEPDLDDPEEIARQPSGGR
jgi:hypothetical protein